MYLNERDIEVPVLLDFLKDQINEVSSFLDIGAYYSWNYYAPAVREILLNKTYHAVDIQQCFATEKIVDTYFAQDVKDLYGSYDFVACISTIEHSGILYQQQDRRNEQYKVLQAILRLANKFAFLSFPFGADNICPGQYANITNQQLEEWIDLALKNKFQTISSFWYNEFPPRGESWKQIDRSIASVIPMDLSKGVQCVCLMKIISFSIT